MAQGLITAAIKLGAELTPLIQKKDYNDPVLRQKILDAFTGLGSRLESLQSLVPMSRETLRAEDGVDYLREAYDNQSPNIDDIATILNERLQALKQTAGRRRRKTRKARRSTRGRTGRKSSRF